MKQKAIVGNDHHIEVVNPMPPQRKLECSCELILNHSSGQCERLSNDGSGEKISK